MLAKTKRTLTRDDSFVTVVPGSIEHVGTTIGHYSTSVSVSSDHAWIDSGNRLVVVYWDPSKLIHCSETLYTDDNGFVVENDAPAEVVELAKSMEKAVSDFRVQVKRIRDEIERNNKVSVGDTVEVFKGRKVPKGNYEVAKIGTGQYGEYYNLRDASGKWHNFISVDNCRKVNIPQPNPNTGNPERDAMLVGIAKSPFGDMTLAVPAVGAYADWLQERGFEEGKCLSIWANAGCPWLPAIPAGV